jgi:O-antigen/teichoic acid export membrane protein
MRKHVKKVLKNPLVYGSAVVVIGNLFANFFNFLFNLYMSRSLSVTDFGILASIITLISFPALLANAINPVVIKFAGDYFAKDELALVRGLYIKFTKFFLLIGIVSFVLFLINISIIGNFFHIENQLILFIANIMMFIYFMTIINVAFLQAKLAFAFSVFISFTSAITKLLLGILFIFMGYEVLGAVGALLTASIVSYILGFIPLKFIFSNKFLSPKIDTMELFRYGIPSALTLIGLTSFISSDILISKHFFTAEQAGLYAGLSLIGRVIFYITVPIGSVMFPIIVRKHANKEDIGNTFQLAALFVLIPSVLLTIFYFIFPNFAIIFFLKKTEYLTIAPYLGYFGLYITLYCLLYILATFYLSIKKTVVYLPVLIGALLQIALIFMYHQNIFQLLLISFILVLLLAIGFLLYYPYATKK